MPPLPKPVRTSGQRSPHLPTASSRPNSASNPGGRGEGDHTPIQRPIPPGRGQDTSLDRIPFPNRAPPGRAAAASTGSDPTPPPAIYFYDESGRPLAWARQGPEVTSAPRLCASNFGPLTVGDVLVSPRLCRIVQIAKTPGLGRSRPRWNVTLSFQLA